MPATEVELDNRDKSFDRIVDLGYREEHFGMAHEAVRETDSACGPTRCDCGRAHFVILSSMLRGSRMKVGSTTRLRSAPGRSWEMMWPSTEAVMVNSLCFWFGLAQTNHCPARARQRGCHLLQSRPSLRQLKIDCLRAPRRARSAFDIRKQFGRFASVSGEWWWEGQ